MNLVVLCPHFAPDVAPTGDVMTRIALELIERRRKAPPRNRAAAPDARCSLLLLGEARASGHLPEGFLPQPVGPLA